MQIALLNRLQLFSQSSLVKNTGWALMTEACSRVSRLLPIVVLIQYLTPEEYGIAMLCMALHEVFRVFMRAGSGSKVVQCNASELPQIIQNAYYFQWLTCLGLGFIQFAAAFVMAEFYHHQQIALILQVMALSYIFYPLVSHKSFWMLRQNDLKKFNFYTAICLCVENFSSTLLAVAGVGILCVAYAKVISALVWVALIMPYAAHPHGRGFSWKVQKQLVAFSTQILGTEMIRSARLQLDVLIAGKLLAHDLLGFYCFAKSAGLGISQSLSLAYTSSLYPYVCTQLREQAAAFNPRKIYVVSSILAAAFVVQAMAAPLYIDMLSSQRWSQSTLVVSLLCISAVPALFLDIQCCFLRAKGLVTQEFGLMIFSILAFSLSIYFSVPNSPVALACCVLFASCAWMLFPATQYISHYTQPRGIYHDK